MVKLIRAPPPENIHGCKRYTNAAAGDLVKTDAIVAAATDRPLGFIIDDVVTDNPPQMLNIYGNGTVIDLTGATGAPAAQNPGVVIWSAGDGTVSTTKPTPGVGSMRYKVGYIVADLDASTSLHMMVDIQGEVQEA